MAASIDGSAVIKESDNINYVKVWGDFSMKQHKFWAWAALFCMAMLFYTGYKHK